MSWAYNQIDVRISQYENVLGDVDPTVIPPSGVPLWEALSTYGLVRGRPTITPSSIDASQLSIPGRMGKPYSLIAGRTNAIFSFELLVADAWPFEEISQQEEFDTVEKRAEYLKAKLMYAKRVCFKEPGRNWDWFFEIYKVDVTESDADEKVSILQVKMEVYPFKFDFSGNEAVSVSANSNYNFTNLVTYYPCNPVFVITTNNTATAPNNQLVIAGEKSGIEQWRRYVEISARDSTDHTRYPIMVIDSNRLLVYGTDANYSTIANFTKYTKGNIDNLRVPKLDTSISAIKFYNKSSNAVTVYPRSGKIV